MSNSRHAFLLACLFAGEGLVVARLQYLILWVFVHPQHLLYFHHLLYLLHLLRINRGPAGTSAEIRLAAGRAMLSVVTAVVVALLLERNELAWVVVFIVGNVIAIWIWRHGLG